ncbi:hypothetical protein BaRGS_00037482 [Batillaria attramentaria]|uniref:Ribosomal protein L15 n=1 Tax=Batillaria attramentaria TaxID=370345 RepID=A0ABD0J9G8_9CAEN
MRRDTRVWAEKKVAGLRGLHYVFKRQSYDARRPAGLGGLRKRRRGAVRCGANMKTKPKEAGPKRPA